MSDRLVICSSPEDDDYVGEHHHADLRMVLTLDLKNTQRSQMKSLTS
jgi:hypothetical protein